MIKDGAFKLVLKYPLPTGDFMGQQVFYGERFTDSSDIDIIMLLTEPNKERIRTLHIFAAEDVDYVSEITEKVIYSEYKKEKWETFKWLIKSLFK